MNTSVQDRISSNNTTQIDHAVAQASSAASKTLKEHFYSLMAKCNRLRDIVARCDSKGMLQKQPQYSGRSIVTRPQVKWNKNTFEYLEFNIDPVQSDFIRDQDKENVIMKLSFGERELTNSDMQQVYSVVVAFRRLMQEEEGCTVQVCEYMIFSHPKIGSENLTIGGCFDDEGHIYHFGATTVDDVIEEAKPITQDVELVQEAVREFATYIAEQKRQHIEKLKQAQQ